MIVSISVSIFDNSFPDDCLSVHQTNVCSGVGESRTPRGNLQQESSPTQHADICVSATFALKYSFRDKCRYLEVPLIWQRKSHITEVIFLEPPLCRWAQHRGEFWVIAHLNNAKCVLLCTRESRDAKWLRWQGRADEMLRHKSLSMFLFFPPCTLVVSEWNTEEVCVCFSDPEQTREKLSIIKMEVEKLN